MNVHVSSSTVPQGESEGQASVTMNDWLARCKIHGSKAKEFINQGYTTVDMFVECSNEDINEIAHAFHLTLPQKLCLKRQIKALQRRSNNNINNVIISYEEQQEIMKMTEKIVPIEMFLGSLQLRTEEITVLGNKCKEEINQTFKELFISLVNRKKLLLNELTHTIDDKQYLLHSKNKEIQEMLKTVQKTLNECNGILKEKVKMDEVAKRRLYIENKSKEVCSLFNINDHSLSVNTSNIKFFQPKVKSCLENIDYLGFISDIQRPNIRSLTNNNEDYVVKVAYNVKKSEIKKQRIKIQWSLILIKNEENKEDMEDINHNHKNIDDNYNRQWNERIFKLKESVHIDVGEHGSFDFRMFYFNGYEWSLASIHKNITFEHFIFNDSWDVNCKGNELIVNNMKVTPSVNINSHQSIFGVKVIERGCHSWKFKIHQIPTYKVWTFCIGITEEDKCETVINNYITANKSGYGFVGAYPGMDTSFGLRFPKFYGKRLAVGDVVEMIVNLDKHQLKYIVNDNDYGIGFDQIPSGKKYRMGVSLYSAADEIELLSTK